MRGVQADTEVLGSSWSKKGLADLAGDRRSPWQVTEVKAEGQIPSFNKATILPSLHCLKLCEVTQTSRFRKENQLEVKESDGIAAVNGD